MDDKNKTLESTEPKALVIHSVVVPKGTLCDKCAELWCITGEEDRKKYQCDCSK